MKLQLPLLSKYVPTHAAWRTAGQLSQLSQKRHCPDLSEEGATQTSVLVNTGLFFVVLATG